MTVRNPGRSLHRSLCKWIDAGLIQYADENTDLPLTIPGLFRDLVRACRPESYSSAYDQQLAFKRLELLTRLGDENITEAKISSRIREARNDGTSVYRWALYGRIIHISESRETWRRSCGGSRDHWWIETGRIARMLFEFQNPQWPLEQQPPTPRALMGLRPAHVRELANFIFSSIHLRKNDEAALGSIIRTSIETALRRVAEEESNRLSDHRVVADVRAYDMLYLLNAMTATATGNAVLDEGGPDDETT